VLFKLDVVVHGDLTPPSTSLVVLARASFFDVCGRFCAQWESRVPWNPGLPAKKRRALPCQCVC
jgi:hypothetical protein